MTSRCTPAPERSATTISPRFTGPFPGWANGGVIVGTLAQQAPPGPSTVRIERPVPVATELEVTTSERGVELWVTGQRLAAAVPGSLDRSALPGSVAIEAAAATTAAVPAAGHPAAGCFVCGPGREGGLDLQPGPAGTENVLATTWTVARDLTDHRTGLAPLPVVVAALDCPGWYAGLGGEPALLGTMTVDVLGPVRAGDVLVVTARHHHRDGRKVHVATALHTPAGTLVAGATATWISTPTMEPR